MYFSCRFNDYFWHWKKLSFTNIKKLFTLVILAISFTSIFSQDLIVSTKGDSINCRMTLIDTAQIFFDIYQEKNDAYINTFLENEEVSSYKIDFFGTVNRTRKSTDTTPVFIENTPRDYPILRVGIYGGYSHRTASIPSDYSADEKNYLKGLKPGSHFGGDICLYFDEFRGIGFKYLVSNSSNTYNNNVYIEALDGSRAYGNMSDDIAIKYYAAILSTRNIFQKTKNVFYGNIGLGYMGYTNNITYVLNFIETGATLGVSFDLGYDIRLTEGIALNLQASYLGGSLTRMTISYGGEQETIDISEEPEALHRFDLSVGLAISIE